MAVVVFLDSMIDGESSLLGQHPSPICSPDALSCRVSRGLGGYVIYARSLGEVRVAHDAVCFAVFLLCGRRVIGVDGGFEVSQRDL